MQGLILLSQTVADTLHLKLDTLKNQLTALYRNCCAFFLPDGQPRTLEQLQAFCADPSQDGYDAQMVVKLLCKLPDTERITGMDGNVVCFNCRVKPAIECAFPWHTYLECSLFPRCCILNRHMSDLHTSFECTTKC